MDTPILILCSSWFFYVILICTPKWISVLWKWNFWIYQNSLDFISNPLGEFSIIAIGEKTKRAFSKYWILMLRRVQCKYVNKNETYFKHWKILTTTKIYLCSFLCEWIEFKKTATHFKSKFQFQFLCVFYDIRNT